MEKNMNVVKSLVEACWTNLWDMNRNDEFWNASKQFIECLMAMNKFILLEELLERAKEQRPGSIMSITWTVYHVSKNISGENQQLFVKDATSQLLSCSFSQQFVVRLFCQAIFYDVPKLLNMSKDEWISPKIFEHLASGYKINNIGAHNLVNNKYTLENITSSQIIKTRCRELDEEEINNENSGDFQKKIIL
ncbi:hypothetical protein KQX54_016501 [Cotesia glomerata]|uniref:Uncharacterized protein n=1 Tax=Cotesia glomerata TaxID=32391 RepID=A0AAV7IRF9_COTGL|nr:hypothetical protein KQX54_016501 [Cotesia glomerata]